MKIKGKAKKRSRANSRGAMVTIATLLISSALIRLGDDAGQAFAKVSDDFQVEDQNTAPAYASCKTPETLAPMLKAFMTREDRLKKQEMAIRDRMHALKLADEEVGRKLTELVKAEEALRATIALADTAAESDLDRLTRVYESMKPKQAAALFEEMNPNFAAGFLGRMRPEAAAGIMASLSPEAAHTFSVVLAGRNANVPNE